MMKPVKFQKDTNAWIFQVWVSFVISMGATAASLYYLPIENTAKSQLGICFLFSISSSFTLAKTIRDNHEANSLFAKIDEAKTEKLLAEYDLKVK